MRYLMGYIRPHLGRLSMQLTIKFAGTVMDLLLPWLLSRIIDDVAPLGDKGRVLLWGLVMVACAGGALAFNVIANRMSMRISRDVTRKLRADLFSKVMNLSSRQTDYFTVPSIISRLTTDTYNVHSFIDRMQRLGVRAPILLLGGILITLTLDKALTLVLVSILPLLAVVIVTVTRKGVPLYTKVQSSIDVMVRKVRENMTGVRVIKALSKGEFEKASFDEANRQLAANERTAGVVMAVTNPVMNLMINVGLTLVIIVGARRVNVGLTQPGTIIAFLSYFSIILNALMMVTRMFVMYSKGAASANRIAQIFDAEDDLRVVPGEAAASPYHVEFKGVGFSYNKLRSNLKDVSFALKRGETLGVIGATGSGKTTLINLLMRFYDVDSGEVLIGGRDIRSIDPEVLHTMFGVVFQNDFLYAGTIAENIDFGRGLTREALEKAAEQAQAGYIASREDGFDGLIASRGADLSGGQRQRLLISRALAGAPEILVLDDCSSALDYKTDAALRKSLKEGFEGATKVIITQRISSIVSANTILVLDDGEVIGKGTHEELLNNCETYREIYASQMGDAA